ncbi:histidine phosphatase family protein [Bacillus sp. FJAT-22090]|uniref:histidine phosphatase family protein n=1 Tax=Bacillus sp. FJAT-22090 TaxID=1581038 RepID=UPI0011AB03CC|nr:histidine phosphatase family protein [Bacillus sp. FJAT-22090]
MTNLYFVRHAHSTFTPDELERPLSERGFEDAKLITEQLKLEDIHHVISSPYKRAIQTVEGVAKNLNKEIEIVEDLRERMLSKYPIANFNEAILKVWSDFNLSLEGGESNNFAQARGVHATLEIIEKYKGQNIAIGTHGNIMVLIMNHFDRKYNMHFWEQLKIPDIYKLAFNEKDLVLVKRINRNRESQEMFE